MEGGGGTIRQTSGEIVNEEGRDKDKHKPHSTEENKKGGIFSAVSFTSFEEESQGPSTSHITSTLTPSTSTLITDVVHCMHKGCKDSKLSVRLQAIWALGNLLLTLLPIRQRITFYALPIISASSFIPTSSLSSSSTLSSHPTLHTPPPPMEGGMGYDHVMSTSSSNSPLLSTMPTFLGGGGEYQGV